MKAVKQLRELHKKSASDTYEEIRESIEKEHDLASLPAKRLVHIIHDLQNLVEDLLNGGSSTQHSQRSSLSFKESSVSTVIHNVPRQTSDNAILPSPASSCNGNHAPTRRGSGSGVVTLPLVTFINTEFSSDQQLEDSSSRHQITKIDDCENSLSGESANTSNPARTSRPPLTVDTRRGSNSDTENENQVSLTPHSMSLKEDNFARTPSGIRTPHRRGCRQRQIVDGAFSKMSKLGAGTTGTVFSVMLKDGSMAALKEVHCPLDPEELGNIQSVRMEVRKLVKLSHPSIIEYYGMTLPDVVSKKKQSFNTSDKRDDVFSPVESPRDAGLGDRTFTDHFGTLSGIQEALPEMDSVRVQIFMELGGSLTLRDLARTVDGGKMKEAVAAGYFRQLTEGLAYVHEQGIVHRDVKGDNVLISSIGECKLADFGAARWHQLDSTDFTIVGTPPFMAPEMLSCVHSSVSFEVSPVASLTPVLTDNSSATTVSEPSITPDTTSYGPSVDIWSLGITVLEALNGGEAPWPHFHNEMELFLHIMDTENQPIVPDHLSDEAKDFVRCCCTRDVKKRPTAEQLLQHPWLRTMDDIVPLDRMPSTGDFSFMVQRVDSCGESNDYSSS